jgi:hypothetical protein
VTFTFQTKTTVDLSAAEIAAMTRLFREVYGKVMPDDLFLRKFAGNGLGRSFHSLMFADGELAGAFSAIPVRFRFFERALLFANTADLMIAPRHRGSLPRFQELAEGLYSALAGAGVAFVFCCLRDEVFQFHRMLSDWRDVGKVRYYIAPFRLPHVGAATGIVRAGLRLAGRFRPDTPAAFAIEKVNDAEFANYRYRVFPVDYRRVGFEGGEAIYLTKPYYPIAGVPAGLRLGLLIDVSPLTAANVDAAVAAIRRREPGLNALAYQGYLPFRTRELFLVPQRFEKQAWTLGGRILLPELVDDRVFDLANWNINLSNGDLV